MAAWKIAPCLAAGCTLVIKPSELTPLTILELGVIIQSANLPAGVVNIVTGTGPVTGNAMLQNAMIDKYGFTGSVPTGSIVMANAAKRIANVTLELGGKSSIIVFDDVSIDQAVEWAMFGCFWTNGQICSATSRLLIHQAIEEKFIARLVQCMRAIPIHDPNLAEVKELKGFIGPVVCKSQYEKILGMINTATSNGAQLIYGGAAKPETKKGFFIRPTLLKITDAKAQTIWDQEVFGPVLCYQSFATEAQAVTLANDSEFGLAGAVISDDLARCERVVRALRVGITWINCSQPAFCQLPWGGLKKSGVGRDLGTFGLDAYLEPKTIVRRVTKADWGWYKLPALL
jgi:betaine-aldehyde dehydrogenase